MNRVSKISEADINRKGILQLKAKEESKAAENIQSRFVDYILVTYWVIRSALYCH